MAESAVGRGKLIKLVTRLVLEELAKGPKIPLGVSNRHIHLNRGDMDALFGEGSELTRRNDLGQPGQYAAEETVSVKGPKGRLDKVRVLGPLRPDTQLEISLSDGFLLGVRPPVRESGKLDGTPGVEIIGPKGSVKKEGCVIAALRHIHMSDREAAFYGFSDKEIVDVEAGSPERSAVFRGVLLRVSDKYALEMHIDTDEANAVGAKNGDFVRIVGREKS
ncbi:MAG: phosphate propanoyltransferase [Synergistaceae bacterium]|nr:phosphate propanoyltransferase [Synergistaceae bacterium]